MMSGCFSPPGGGDPWGHDYGDDRLYRMSARKFNKHMAEKRRRCRINTALERLKYIILHVMRRNPENFDKMEKADILDMTVKFLKAVQKQEGLLGSSRPPPAHSHHRTTSTSTSTTHQGAPPARPAASNIRVFQDPPQPSAPCPSAPRPYPKERVFPGLKSRSGNIPSAVVRAVQGREHSSGSCIGSTSGSTTTSGSGFGSTSGFGSPTSGMKRPASATVSCSPRKRHSSASEGYPASKMFKSPSSTCSSSAGSSRDYSSEESPGAGPFGLHLEYRVHSAFHFHRPSQDAPLFYHPVPKRFTPGVVPHAAASPRVAASAAARCATTDAATTPKTGSLTVEVPPAARPSKTGELKIDIPQVEVNLPPLQPVGGAPASPQHPLPLPLLPADRPAAMWRPW